MPAASPETAPPSVSVVIPTYNCEAYISETLGSVLAQTFRDLEILVVDDGSRDRTREIVAAYGPPVRLLTQENARVCAARNRGLSEARGRFVCFMDHDDYWFPDKLARQVAALEAHPEAGVVFANFLLWHPDAQGVYPVPASFDLDAYPEGIEPDFSGWIYHQFLLDCWMLTSTAMFRAEVLQRCGAFDVALPYSEDWDLWLRLSREYPFIKLSRPNTLYRQHPLQGNRVVRPVDYRTELLSQAVARWGLCSPDGRCQDAAAFRRQLARYHTEFAMGHALAGNPGTARRSLLKAWRAQPLNPKPLAYLVALAFGWRPDW
ncbi:MAG TPA: glycosyltransferase [Thiobacillaceae bacterium]|nr:glycosyltransferase [Thiobacillaceae bacterium]